MTDKKPVFLETNVKKIIELNMNLKDFSTRNESLVDMLKESPRYFELGRMLGKFNTPEVTPIASGDSHTEPEGNILTDKEVEELLDVNK